MIELKRIAGMNQHYRSYSLDYFLNSQREAGFESVELWCGSPHFSLDWRGFSDCGEVLRKARQYGLEIVSVTAPSFANQYRFAASDPYHAARSLEYFRNGVRVAASLGCRIMTINSGFGALADKFDDLWNISRDMIGELCETAFSEGVILAMESLRRDESNIVNDLPSAKRMHDEISHPSLKAMIDTVAMGHAGETLDEWFDAFGDDLVHMHFVDGHPPVHAIWGDGGDPLEEWLTTLERRSYKGYLVQEIADERYFDDPAGADRRNMAVLKRFTK